MKECLRLRLAIACVALQTFDREREGNLGARPRARSPEKVLCLTFEVQSQRAAK